MKHLLVCDDEMELAKKEPPIEGTDLLLEILPLLQEYFVGEITLEERGIVYRLPNGQSFLITAKQE